MKDDIGENIDNFLMFAKNKYDTSVISFDYRSYIPFHDEIRELFSKIIEEMQYLEKQLKTLYYNAQKLRITEKNLNKNLTSMKIIQKLSNNVIGSETAKTIEGLIHFRNYLIHEHYLNKNDQQNIENYFPCMLYIIFETEDYIQNKINDITGNPSKVYNIYEDK